MPHNQFFIKKSQQRIANAKRGKFGRPKIEQLNLGAKIEQL
jgi:hypothetical protein